MLISSPSCHPLPPAAVHIALQQPSEVCLLVDPLDRQSTWSWGKFIRGSLEFFLAFTYKIIYIIYHISYWITYQFVCVSSWDKASCSNSLMSLHSWSLWTLWSFVQKIATWRMQISIRWAASNSQALEVSQASWRRRNSAALSVSASQSVGPCKRKWEPRNMPSNLSVTTHHHAKYLAVENSHSIEYGMKYS